MALLEPSGPQGPAAYRAPSESRRSWSALAHEIDPEVAHYFLVSARCGCFMQAARSLNIKATLLRKRLAQLEQQVRHVLFSYQGSGLVLSRDGQHLQAQLIALAHERRLPVLEQPLIRLAVAEPILHDILGRDLIALLRRNASVRLEIISLDGQLSLQAVDVDVVLWLSDAEGPTPGPSFITEAPRPLARLCYLPHIAKRYSRLTTRPDSVDDLDDYMLVQWQPDAQVNALQPWNRVVEQRLAAVVQVQAYSLMLEMIRCGACIGLLPHYMSSFDRGLVALPGLLADSMQRQVWLAVNAQVEHADAVQMIVELIVGTFEERREWFD
ncbi:LysR family transcriptional regulator [Pseudomonas extremaustralis]|jgi:DNA-binding transcriptional LysR family regulator|uniref:LysR family transcriptional regulator n=1 Tax=Pseudomonas extremaustralis TaxID=359110 RepID=A0A5C5QKN5_9PSED|nr:LysR family transcriptional regulator [Pseudomonas extremaustralis]EZI28680.1 LysR family transcriptional regulator [Pseudomonas extremaustralis 14-3 substr. 14-3b]MDB1113623.1 LysR family transcriptional regulator [Pseudomonas extremaustralis]MDF3136367.1 LysR family transcriptional regulator [Pseudomonas extremaustralis]MDG2971072.1 LysR family transcriptional regulator [Pseudomonas extremaustralis]TWS05731.1 LysR family transcriptional regulator [Pseudomonas extremaustralis]